MMETKSRQIKGFEFSENFKAFAENLAALRIVKDITKIKKLIKRFDGFLEEGIITREEYLVLQGEGRAFVWELTPPAIV